MGFWGVFGGVVGEAWADFYVYVRTYVGSPDTCEGVLGASRGESLCARAPLEAFRGASWRRLPRRWMILCHVGAFWNEFARSLDASDPENTHVRTRVSL